VEHDGSGVPESLTIGDVRRDAAFNHLQGDNPEHDRGDCGIVSCADVPTPPALPASPVTVTTARR